MQARSRPLIRLAAAALVALVLASGIAPRAVAIPSPSNSSVPARIVICPAGDSVLVVFDRDLANNPRLGDEVWIDVCGCPGFHLSSQQSACVYPDTSHCVVAMISDLQGVVEIPVSGGGLCPGGTLRVYAGGVLLAIRPEPACFDQNGDLRVDAADVAIVQSKLGTNDAGADFDGDGVVTALDVALVQLHVGHAAPPAPAPAR